jgi:hypothetical protein
MTRVLVAVAAFALTACGTVMHGSRDTIFVDSRPDGAAASISCAGNVEARGTTPAKLVIPRRAQGCSVTVERAGHKTQRLDLDQSFSGAFWSNFAFSPILAGITLSDGGDFGTDTAVALLSSGVAFLVDQFTGAKYTYEPKEIVIELEPAGP